MTSDLFYNELKREILFYNKLNEQIKLNRPALQNQLIKLQLITRPQKLLFTTSILIFPTLFEQEIIDIEYC